MARKTIQKKVDRAKSSNYKIVANNFFNGAEVAREYEYWNAAGVLIVHAAIAYADSVTIKLGGVKSQGEDHYDTISLLDEFVAPNPDKKNALNQLKKIIDHKTSVSYSGDIYEKEDVDRLWKLLERFRNWALTVLR
jgi:hypothetical protein